MNAEQFDEVVQPFAEGILALSKARASDSLSLSTFQDARFREAISTLIRKACDVLYPALLVPEVSIAARAAAQTLGVDLRRESWHSQKKFDPGYKILHYEHMQPVGVLLTMTAEASSVEEVVDLLRRELRLAWITKEEDQKLNALGYKSKRRDPDVAYAEAGIVMTSRSATLDRSDREGEPPPTDDSAGPREPTSKVLPPIVEQAMPDNGPHEKGFVPASKGDVFQVAQLGMCLGGIVQIWVDDGVSAWSVGSDSTLVDAQCRGFLSRTRRGANGFREVAMFNSATGTLLLQPRFPAGTSTAESGEKLSFEASLVQLAPPVKPMDSWEGDLQRLLAKAVQHTLDGQGQLRVETGGWDAPSLPFCSVERAFGDDGTPVLLFEASPAPSDSRWWKDHMHMVDASTARIMRYERDFDADKAAFLLWDALDWDGVTPWDLVLTYAVPPRGIGTP